MHERSFISVYPPGRYKVVIFIRDTEKRKLISTSYVLG